MAKEGGEWIMKGLDWDNPYRIRSWRELINWINEVGFFLQKSMFLLCFGGPATPSRIPGSGGRSFPRQERWHTASFSITRPDSFPGNGFRILQMRGGTDTISMRRGTTNWCSAATKQSWISVRTAECIRGLN